MTSIHRDCLDTLPVEEIRKFHGIGYAFCYAKVNGVVAVVCLEHDDCRRVAEVGAGCFARSGIDLEALEQNRFSIVPFLSLNPISDQQTFTLHHQAQITEKLIRLQMGEDRAEWEFLEVRVGMDSQMISQAPIGGEVIHQLEFIDSICRIGQLVTIQFCRRSGFKPKHFRAYLLVHRFDEMSTRFNHGV